MKKYEVTVYIQAIDDEAAAVARDELINAGQDAEDSGECAKDTFCFGMLETS